MDGVVDKTRAPPGTADDSQGPECKWEVVHREPYGRCILAKSDISEGEIIFTDSPIVIGPKLNSGYICLGCYTTLDPQQLPACSRCGWPVCDLECESRGSHHLECDVMSKSKYEFNLKDFGEENPLYEAILPLRCLLLQDTDEAKWKTFIAMESHDDLRRGGEIWNYEQKNVCDFLRHRVGLSYSDELIHRITGVLDVNCHEVRSQHPGKRSEYRVRGVYPLCAMMSHDCTCNTQHSILDDHTMIVMAAISIPAGQQITGIYTHLLSGTAERRNYLRYGKFFDCVCSRCRDPTELGTFFSALRCTRPGCSGDVLCKNPLQLDNKADYACNKCGHEVPGAVVSSLLDAVGSEIQSVGDRDTGLLEELLKKYSSTLHPEHYHVTGIKCTLAQTYGRLTDHPMHELTEDELRRKAKYCRDVLDALDKISPGISRLRGLVAFELHVPLLLGANKTFQQRLQTREELLQTMQEVLKLLMQTVHCLQFESQSAFEGQICKHARDNCTGLQQWMATVQRLPDDNFAPTYFSTTENKLSEQDLTLEDLLKQLDGP